MTRARAQPAQRLRRAPIESDLHFREIFSHVGTGVAITDHEGRLVQCNPQYCKFLGYRLAELRRINFSELVHPDDRETNLVYRRRLLAGEIPSFDIENRYRHKDGTPLWVHKFVSLLPDERGKPSHILALVTDITARKQAEAALRENRELLRLFIEHAPAAVAMFDREMRYVAASRRWINDFQIAGNVTGRSHYDLFPEIPERWKAIHRRALNGEVIADSNDRFDRADGTTQWLRWEVRPWHDATGNQGGILIFSEDITEDKQAEQQLKLINETLEQRVTVHTADLRATQRRLEHLLVSATGVIYSSRATGEMGTMYMSQNTRQVSGYDPQQFITDSTFWQTRVHPDDLPGVHDAFTRARQSGTRVSVDYRFRCGDGSYRWMHDEAQPIKNDHGDVVEFVGYWSDITERKLGEVQIAAYRAEMEQAQQRLVVSHTIGAIAHELNQPLSAVASYSETALRLLRAGGMKTEQLTTMLEKSAAQAQRAGRTLRELLTVLHAREAVSGPLDLVQAAREAIRAFTLDGEVQYTPVLKAPPDLPQVQAIPVYVEKILLNLFRNAAEAMRGASEAAEDAPARASIQVVIDRPTNGRFLQLTVCDGGPGVAPNIADKILQPFYTTKVHGAGMGLAICRTLAETQGGRLWLDADHPGPGACFHFTLPIAS